MTMEKAVLAVSIISLITLIAYFCLGDIIGVIIRKVSKNTLLNDAEERVSFIIFWPLYIVAVIIVAIMTFVIEGFKIIKNKIKKKIQNKKNKE